MISDTVIILYLCINQLGLREREGGRQGGREGGKEGGREGERKGGERGREEGVGGREGWYLLTTCTASCPQRGVVSGGN